MMISIADWDTCRTMGTFALIRMNKLLLVIFLNVANFLKISLLRISITLSSEALAIYFAYQGAFTGNRRIHFTVFDSFESTSNNY